MTGLKMAYLQIFLRTGVGSRMVIAVHIDEVTARQAARLEQEPYLVSPHCNGWKALY